MAELFLEETVAYGADAGRGNLLGIQPYMLPADYASEQSFYDKIDGYLRVAQEQGWLSEKTVVVLPEYLGAWLVATGEKPRVYETTSVAEAMRTIILGNPISFAMSLLMAKAQDVLRYTVFMMKAPRMAESYFRVFSRLASQYRVTIVAGSILLPTPSIGAGKLVAGRGMLQNVTLVFRPDGSPHEEITRKAYPIATERPFVTPAEVQALPVYDTPAGKLGVLICADSWYPEPYQVLHGKGAELLAVPSYLSPDGVWQQRWRGYSGGTPPADVDVADMGAITEGQAWLRYAMAGRARQAGIAYGLNVFLRGRIWDLGSEGHTVALRGDEVQEARHVEGAALVNSWLA